MCPNEKVTDVLQLVADTAWTTCVERKKGVDAYSTAFKKYILIYCLVLLIYFKVPFLFDFYMKGILGQRLTVGHAEFHYVALAVSHFS